MMASMHGIEIVDVPRGDPITEPVVVDGQHVGTVALRFPSSHLPTPERQARGALARTILAGGALAIVVPIIAEIGRAAGRERVGQVVWISVVAVSIKKKDKQIYTTKETRS